MRHFLTLNDFGKDEILEIINLAREIKKEAKAISALYSLHPTVSTSALYSLNLCCQYRTNLLRLNSQISA